VTEARAPPSREVEALARLQAIAARFVREGGIAPVLDDVLDAAVAITGADMGSIRELDPESGELVVVAHRGYAVPELLAGISPWPDWAGRSLARGERLVVPDVAASPHFGSRPDLRQGLLQAGVRAFQSTPLLSRSGEWLGVLSTHWRVDGQPVPPDLHLLDVLARQTADLIERSRLDDALRESERRYRELVDVSPDAILVHRSGRIEFANPAAAELFGVASARDLVGRSPLDLFHPDDHELIRGRIARLLGGEARVNPRIALTAVRRSGGTRRVEATAVVYDDRQGRVIQVVLNDVGERERMEEALRASEERYRRFFSGLLEAATISRVVRDRAGEIVDWVFQDANAACEEIPGATRAEIVGRPASAVLRPEDFASSLPALREVMGARKGRGYETRFGGRDFRGSMFPLDGDTFVRTGIDVTEQKRAETALRASREQLRELAARLESIREEEKTRLARDLHDDMGQLLTGLTMDLEAIEEGLTALPAEGPVPALLERAVDASELAARTADSLQRAVSALRPAALDRLGLCPALRQECRRFQARTGIRCELIADEEPAGYGADQDTALFRIAQEALTNVARHARASRVEVAVEGSPEEVVLRVQDDGRGVDPAAVPPRSMGIVGMRERAERLGGELAVAPGPSGGTVVRVRLPLAGGRTGGGA
jgi:PAS domain S-box-containing protein